MKLLKNYKSSLINLLICFFPISLIIGNQATNMFIFFFIFFSLIVYSKDIIKIKFNSFDNLLFLFFLYIFIALVFNYTNHYLEKKVFPDIILVKTIFFYKYLFLYIILRFLIYKNILNLKLFYIFCSVCVLTVSFDIFFQFIFGHNILGIEPYSSRHYSSFFGEELIAGGYIQRFSFFVFFSLFFLKKEKFNIFFIVFFLIIFLIAIALSGNRMPLVLYLLSILIFFILKRNLIKYMIKLFFVFFIILILLYNFNANFKVNTKNFYFNSKNLISLFFTLDLKDSNIDSLQKPYASEFLCAKIIIKKNPIFGGGIKSFRTHDNGCYTHPHNYFLEITSELGLVGLLIFVIFLIKLFLSIFKNIWKLKYSYISQITVMPAFLLLLAEFFPFRSSGSFFTTGNASIIFIFLAILVSTKDFKITKY